MWDNEQTQKHQKHSLSIHLHTVRILCRPIIDQHNIILSSKISLTTRLMFCHNLVGFGTVRQFKCATKDNHNVLRRSLVSGASDRA